MILVTEMLILASAINDPAHGRMFLAFVFGVAERHVDLFGIIEIKAGVRCVDRVVWTDEGHEQNP
jgi:hypothetical protein